jgi:hypothetical protein
MTRQPFNQVKADAFVGKVLADTAALAITVLSSVGDRLGLYKTLAKHGPATSVELADHAHVNERYVREWLRRCANLLMLAWTTITMVRVRVSLHVHITIVSSACVTRVVISTPDGSPAVAAIDNGLPSSMLSILPSPPIVGHDWSTTT